VTLSATEIARQADESTVLERLSQATVETFSRERGEPEWLLEARLAAWDRFEALPMPTSRDEAWKRTDISGLRLEQLAVPADGQAGSRGAVKLADEATERAGSLLIHNGQLQERFLDEKLASRSVLLLPLAEAVSERPDLVRAFLERDGARQDGGKFAALSLALWNDGVLLYLPRGLAVEAPFQVVHWSDAPGASLARTVVVAEAGSSAAVVESHASPADRPESLASGTVDLIVGQDARLSYVQLQDRDQQTWNFASMRSEQERDSAVTWLLLGLGSRLSRTELSCDLNGQGSEADLIGLVFGEGQQFFDYQTLQNHVGDDSRSDLLLKVALRDQASSNFTGMIRVGKTALRTASNQENRNLLLSGQAKADSDPKLEILNSDVVRCGHGATVGPVDEEMIFYLMTRGLSHDQAERLIVEGFFEPLLARVPLESIRERLWTSIHRKLEK
jgi:Fe-S cluster assembly protein SufD